MSTKGRYRGGVATWFDNVTGETTLDAHPVNFEDDFLGAGSSAAFPTTATVGSAWIKKIVGVAPPTVASVANAADGQFAAALTATSEKQDAALYQGDSLAFDGSAGALFECRAKLSVLPSAAQVQMVLGLQSAWIDGPDNASFYCGFGFLGNGNVIIRTKDGVTTNAIASSVTVLNTEWHNYQVDMSDPTNVIFYVDGQNLATTSPITFAATGANAIMQPYVSAYKASGTGVGTLTVDFIAARCNRT